MINSFLLAFAMYSRIPMPRADWSGEKMKYVMCFFPLIGLAVGAAVYGFSLLCSLAGLPELFRASGLTLIPILITGGIHMDGFLDTVDALSSHQTREKKLEILKDSHTGAFAIIFGGVYLTASLGIWSGIRREAMGAMALSFVFSRGLSGMSVVTFRNARGSGMLAAFQSGAEKRITRVVLAFYLLLAGGGMVLLSPAAGGAAAGAGLLEFLYYRYKSYKEFGGITGDLAGCFLQLCELFMGLAAALAGCL